eukprot:6421599-Amphidinium_carterae.1
MATSLRIAKVAHFALASRRGHVLRRLLGQQWSAPSTLLECISAASACPLLMVPTSARTESNSPTKNPKGKAPAEFTVSTGTGFIDASPPAPAESSLHGKCVWANVAEALDGQPLVLYLFSGPCDTTHGLEGYLKVRGLHCIMANVVPTGWSSSAEPYKYRGIEGDSIYGLPHLTRDEKASVTLGTI